VPPRRPSRTAGATESDLKELHKQISAGNAAPVYLVTGDDGYRRGQIARNLGRWIVPEEERDVCLVVLDGAECTAADIATRLDSGTLAFFGSARRVVSVHDCPLLGSKPPGGKEALEPLARRLKAGLPSDTTLIIEAPSIDSRTALVKRIKEIGVVLEFPQLEGGQALRTFVTDRLRRARVRADGQALEYLLAACSDDTRQLANEVAKLVSYVGPQGTVDEDAVREVVSVSRGAVVFDLTDAIAERNVERALGLVRGLLAQGESAVGLAMRLAGRFRLVYQARLLMDRYPKATELARQRYSYRFGEALRGIFTEDVAALFPDHKPLSLTKQHPFVVYKTLQAAEGFTEDELCDAVMYLAELDFALKTTTGLDDVALLEIAVVEICGGEGRGAGKLLARAIR